VKVESGLTFYHIPKFLKNEKRSNQKTRNQHSPSLSLDGMLISKLSEAAGVSGGAKRDRTVDLLRARQALSQLSYGPKSKLVGLGRFELPTSPLSGVRSNQLSYRPNFELVAYGLELKAASIVFFNESSNSCGCLRNSQGLRLRR
jgi:hypothetical protein